MNEEDFKTAANKKMDDLMDRMYEAIEGESLPMATIVGVLDAVKFGLMLSIARANRPGKATLRVRDKDHE